MWFKVVWSSLDLLMKAIEQYFYVELSLSLSIFKEMKSGIICQNIGTFKKKRARLFRLSSRDITAKPI